MWALRLLWACLLLTLVPTEAAEAPVVRTASGAVRGVHLSSFSGRQYAAFRGIPYARPPVGELRFAAPQPAQAWSGVRDAAQYGSSCLQYSLFHALQREGDEDCLFVNVFTPRLPAAEGAASTAGLPVLVWIYGGGFISGSGDDELHGADYLMDEDVVVVTLNYRLGVFGFYTSEDAAAPGNMGLRDQQLALRWVQQNIERFGGDRQRVAIFGESAGSASVSLQVLSPLAAGTFQRAISQSGAATGCWVLGAKQRPLAQTVARKLGCDNGDSSDWISCLRRVDAGKLLEAYGPFSGLNMEFHPRVDGADTKSPVLPAEPNLLLQRGEFNRVPRMIGQVAEEGHGIFGFVQSNEKLMKLVGEGDLNAWISEAIMGGGGIADKTDNPLEVSAKIRDNALNSSGGDLVSALIKLVADRFMTLSIDAETRLTAQHVPVYSYLLDEDRDGQLRFIDLVAEQWRHPSMVGAPPTHADDLAYLFRGRAQTPVKPGSPQHNMIRLFTQLWTSFAGLGYPTCEVAPAWPLFTERHQRHLRLNTAPSVGSHLFRERVQFWRSLPLRESWNAETWADDDATKRAQSIPDHTEL